MTNINFEQIGERLLREIEQRGYAARRWVQNAPFTKRLVGEFYHYTRILRRLGFDKPIVLAGLRYDATFDAWELYELIVGERVEVRVEAAQPPPTEPFPFIVSRFRGTLEDLHGILQLDGRGYVWVDVLDPDLRKIVGEVYAGAVLDKNEPLRVREVLVAAYYFPLWVSKTYGIPPDKVLTHLRELTWEQKRTIIRDYVRWLRDRFNAVAMQLEELVKEEREKVAA